MLYNLVDNISEDLSISLKLVHRLCEVINTPRSLAVSLLLQYQEFGQYLGFTIDPSAYEDPQHFAEDYLVTEILRKHPDLPLGINKSLAAFDNFKLSEAQCFSSNIRLNQEYHSWQHEFSRNISRILGPLTQDDLQFIDDHMRHGSGATTGVRGMGSVASVKYDRPIHTTVDLLPFFRSILGDSWWEHQGKNKHTVSEGNKFTTVPKTAKTERGICIEPTLNMYVQLGIGAAIRQRLKRFGIDLNTQEVNRQLASRAYSSELATIDLSMASDSVCTNVILKHFPERWVHLLYTSRSHFCVLPDGTTRELEKWSSMGNGYTFELETLVFYALCMTFVPLDEMQDVSVYGDDIIIPRQYTDVLINALNFLGFRVNTSKSFLAGNFFESCGSDYFKGINVRPLYLKGCDDIHLTHLRLANKIRLWAHRVGYSYHCPLKYHAIWFDLVMKIPRKYRSCKVPPELGDAGIISSLDEAKPALARDWIEGYVVRHLVTKPATKQSISFGVLLHTLTRRGYRLQLNRLGWLEDDDLVECLFTKGRETVRGYLRGVRTKTTIVYRWGCGFEWS